MTIIAAIPCYNEWKTIGSTVILVKRHVDEVIVVDDGSTDGSGEIAARAGATVVRHECNKGYGEAIKTAFSVAKRRGAEVLITIDADGQHDPQDIPRLVTEILEGHSVVTGVRTNCDVPLYRRVGMKVLDWLTGVPVSDSQCGYRAYGIGAIEGLELRGSGMSVGSEILIRAKELGLRIKEIPIEVKYGKAKRNPVVHGVGVVQKVLSMVSIRKPLPVIGLPSVVLVVAGVGTGVVTAMKFHEHGVFPVGYGIVTAVLLLVGLQGVLSAVMLWAVKENMEERR